MAARRGLRVRVPLLPHQHPPPGLWTLWLLYGGRGLGKTRAGMTWLLLQALAYPGTYWGAVAQTWSKAQRILAEGPAGIRGIVTDPRHPELEWMLAGGKWGRGSYRRAPGDTAVTLANGSVIEFASADDPDALRGYNWAGAFADELFFWRRSAYTLGLAPAVRVEPAPGVPARIAAGSTPDGENWAYEQWVRPALDGAPQPGVVFIGGKATPPDTPPSTFDNPHLAGTTVQNLRAAYEGTDDARQELYGHFLSLRGQIYKALSITRHSRDAVDDPDAAPWPEGPEDCDEVIAGQDLGTEAPSALAVLARARERWHVVAEVEQPAATEDDWHEAIRPVLDRWRPSRIWSDSNYPQTTEAQRRRGLPVRHADKGPESVRDGIREVQRVIASDQLAVDTDACDRTWRELRNYRWETDRDGNVILPERPAKVADHTADAVRYALYMEARKAPRRVTFV